MLVYFENDYKLEVLNEMLIVINHRKTNQKSMDSFISNYD